MKTVPVLVLFSLLLTPAAFAKKNKPYKNSYRYDNSRGIGDYSSGYRGNLPPGLQRQLHRRGALPPGLQKRNWRDSDRRYRRDFRDDGFYNRRRLDRDWDRRDRDRRFYRYWNRR